MKGRLLLISLMVVMLVGCRDRYREIYSVTLLPGKNCRVLDDSLLSDSLEKFNYSRLSKGGTYAMRLIYPVPIELRGQELLVTVSGWSRTTNAYSNAIVVVSTSNAKKGQTSWDALHLAYSYTAMNTWCAYRDSVKLRADYYGKLYDQITVYTHLPKDGEKFDTDQMKVTVFQKEK